MPRRAREDFGLIAADAEQRFKYHRTTYCSIRVQCQRPVSLSEIKSEHSDGVIRRAWESGECARRPEQSAAAAHPYSERDVSARCYNSAYKKGAHGAGAARQRRRHVKTFPPDRANQPFRMTILPWRLGRSWPVANAHGTKPPGENFAIERIAIADDVVPVGNQIRT